MKDNIRPVDVLYKYWGYGSFRECQEEIIEAVLAGRDTIGLLPTGGGKSITFQVPSLMLDGLTVVVTPLISLMKDQVDNLRERGVRAACLHSGMARAERRLTLDRLDLGKTKILYVSPEKLAGKDFHHELKRWDVSFIVVDEAHCISQWGYDFRPSYLNLQALRREFPDAPILALTASATPEVVADIADKLGMNSPQVISKSFSRQNISYVVRHTDDKPRQLLKVLSATSGSSIVYARSRRRTAELAQLLQSYGISADFYHAGLEPHDKTEKQDRWKNDEIRVMVATNAFGMGIDKPDVRVVVHFDIPPTLEEYYQEAGRAGRDGKESFAVLLASQPDKALMTRRLNENFPGREYILSVYERVGNYLNVSVGSGYDQVYEFNIAGFLKTFDLKPSPTVAALRTLTRAGAIEFNENYNSRSRVSFTVDKRDLYDLRVDDTTDRVLQALLRSYTGLFADFISIDEVHLGQAARCTPQQVYDSLLLLSRMKILSYVPKTNMPFIYYPTSRDLPKHVVIPRAVYEDLYERAMRRMEAMRDYVFSPPGCRVSHMLRYFGEADPEPCGKCDICRAQKQAPRPADLSAHIDNVLNQNVTASLAQLIDGLPEARRDEALDILRQRLEQGTVKAIGSGFRKV